MSHRLFWVDVLLDTSDQTMTQINVFHVVVYLFIIMFLIYALCISACEALFLLPEMLSTYVASILHPALTQHKSFVTHRKCILTFQPRKQWGTKNVSKVQLFEVEENIQ